MTPSNDVTAPPTTSYSGAADWLHYPPPAGALDELFDQRGEPRPHWQPFLQSFGHLGHAELWRRWGEARHLIHENGVTYNVYGDPRGLDRPWQLDPVPLVLAPAEAEALAAGLVQRGRLLDALLRDLYGPQETLADGLLPPELVFANPAFLRPCHGARLPGARHLHLYAADVGRGRDGNFCVLGDRTQAPSGAGYALENRIVLSRMLPDTFRDCRVQRLALFFRTLRDTLHGLAPHNRDNPRIVLLTPGPFNETYFEHAYLARYLGFTLVEGGDLTVRDGRVYLKILGGLRLVDVILRRLDDDFCDPLELRSDSSLGIPGLVEAVHAGTVAVANALGSGLPEMPALLAFLPRLCRRLLGEELRLSSVPTWWCGESEAQAYVLAHLEELAIKPALSGTRREPVFVGELSRDERDRLAEAIRARPQEYVGQVCLPLSTAPTLAGGRFEPRHVTLRAYLAAHEDSYAVMPGGLTRMGAAAGSRVVSMQRGGGSKDTWVLSAGPVSTFSLLGPSGQPVQLSRGGGGLPSRVADNLFWLGRYAERAEGLTRLLRAVLVRLTELPGLDEAPELPALLEAVVRRSGSRPGFPGERTGPAAEAELLAVIHDVARPGSLAATLSELARIAGTVRDRISLDMWRVLSELGKAHARGPFPTAGGRVGVNGGGRTLSDELELLDRLVLALAAFGGLAMESVTRTDGWRFLDMGRKLERCLNSLGLLRATLVTVSGPEGPLLEALLEIADSAMTYRRRYQGAMEAAGVLDLVLADDANPRSLAFQLAALADDVERLPRDSGRPGPSPEERLTLTARTDLCVAEVPRLAWVVDGRRDHLDDLLSRLAANLFALSEALTQTYFSHLQTARHLAVFPSYAER